MSDPDLEAEITLTMLAATSLMLDQLQRFGDLTYPATAENMLRLRDDLEGLSLIAAPPALTPDDLNTVFVNLVSVRTLHDSLKGRDLPVRAIPDLLEALSLPRLESALNYTLDAIDRGAGLRVASA
ncbi:hypothetical protein [Deinococcus sp. QL22]|uniref:hypothetical protein n=1 Tax=Deinococcus sp. QL22 TaxID=2939437 RepID=UPI0020174C33|nr:hypothetical protein [Deinococcus sp. QL22]UQN10409.1 hypothetical protein M1R55_30105 [Deinococcus sp. QL22]UQN10543.1 hypothetical protein M1R55_29430 [Deinococcus sp. QL22]